MVVGRAANDESANFDKGDINMCIKMNFPTMGPTTEFKHSRSHFLSFMSLKAAYLIPHMAVRDSGAYQDKGSHSFAFALMLHAACGNKRPYPAVK
jgi:hypothetical protein